VKKGGYSMSAVLIIPERNEGETPLFVAEQGLGARRVKAVYIVDGWSSDDTFIKLSRALPEMQQRHPNRRIELFRSYLRATGKGGAMVTGLQRALDAGYRRMIFLDGDIQSVTPRWCELLLWGLETTEAAMARGYFDRSPLDAQITRHITRPLMSIYFPEGRAIHQPLGGELVLTDELAHYLLVDQMIDPPHHWGIDTFLTVNTVVEGFHVAEVYLTQKAHKRKTLTQLRAMLVECFDEMCRQIDLHRRLDAVPDVEEIPVEVLKPEEPPTRVGEDVRTLRYIDVEEQKKRFFTFVKGMREPEARLRELGLSDELRGLVIALFEESSFQERSAEFTAQTWVPLVDQLAGGYIAQNYSPIYHDVVFACWQLRTLAFALHEAKSFEEAEAATEGQAKFAYEYGARYRK
jgi:hypothetical protein